MTFEKPREIAFRILERRARTGAYLEDLLEEAFGAVRLSPPDRHLTQELVYGCVRWETTLDWLIARRTQSRQQKSQLQILLRLGLYQMFWLDRVPDHAAVHETIELAKQQGFGPQSGFLNAVLRGCARERDTTQSLLADLRERNLPLGWSHPEWIVERWTRRWGSEPTRRLLEWNNTPPATFARANTLALDTGKLIERWREEGVDYDFRRYEWTGENLVFQLKSHPPLHGLPSFQAGGFYLQDPSTLLAVHALDPQPGDTVLDLCAAPGGKATFIAQRMQNCGRLVAADISRDRLDMLQQNAERLGASLIEIAVLEERGGLQPLPPAGVLVPFPSHFDRVLVDAPCSNTGVMRRRVELRWRIRPEEIERLRKQELQLLCQAAGWVRPGGTLIYSTCSLEPEENQEVIGEFLRSNPGFTLERERQLLPFAEGVDGAYVARLRWNA